MCVCVCVCVLSSNDGLFRHISTFQSGSKLRSKPGCLYVSWISYPRSIVSLGVREGMIFEVLLYGCL